MSDRNWEAELAKIDKQLASVSDDQLLPERSAPQLGKGAAVGRSPATDARMANPAGAKAAAGATSSTRAEVGGRWKSWLKVSMAVAAAAGLMYWPWPARCGMPLVGFTAATGGVALLGIWSAVGAWRHRLGLAHLASVLVTAWGLVLGAREVLPRVGYAIPTEARAGQWSCEGLPALPSAPAPTITPDSIPGATGTPA